MARNNRGQGSKKNKEQNKRQSQQSARAHNSRHDDQKRSSKGRSYRDSRHKDEMQDKNSKRRLTSGGKNVIEGRHAIEEALNWGMRLKCAYVANDSGLRDGKFDRIVKRLQDNNIEVYAVDNQVLDSMSVRGSHQGIAAEIAPYEYADIDDVIQRSKDKENALIVLLDHVTDDGNFGAIVRSAEIVGAEGVVIPNARSAKVSAGSASTSVGAVFKMDICQVPNLATVLDKCKEAGFWVFGASEHAHDVVWDSKMRGKVVLVMGSEGDGISRRILDKCDVLTKLPQRGEIESLNVAQAATVMCFEWMRQSFGGLS